MRLISGAALPAALLFCAVAFAQGPSPTGERPLVIAHRGASGYLPEHTIEAYRLAIEMGADFIEPDLVATRDGVLIARHEPMLSGTTDVAERPELASRRTLRLLDGLPVTDWFASDFTLPEIRQLRARQAFADRDQSHNGKYLVPTLAEVIALVREESARRGRTIGLYPETKHPAFHGQVGLALEDRLLEQLAAAGWTDRSAPVIIQSFEAASLKYLRSRTGLRLVQLIGGAERSMVTPAGLAEIRRYADGIGPAKSLILPTQPLDRDGDGKPDDLNGDGRIDARDRVAAAPTRLVGDARAAGLFVHAWTFRSEPRWLAADFKGEPAAEYRVFFELGVEGVFSDFPDVAVRARR